MLKIFYVSLLLVFIYLFIGWELDTWYVFLKHPVLNGWPVSND